MEKWAFSKTLRVGEHKCVANDWFTDVYTILDNAKDMESFKLKFEEPSKLLI